MRLWERRREREGEGEEGEREKKGEGVGKMLLLSSCPSAGNHGLPFGLLDTVTK